MKRLAKILGIISTVVMVIGIFISIGLGSALLSAVFGMNPMYMDGSDVSGCLKIFGAIAGVAVATIPVSIAFGIVTFIWLAFLIFVIVKYIIDYNRNKNLIDD